MGVESYGSFGKMRQKKVNGEDIVRDAGVLARVKSINQP